MRRLVIGCGYLGKRVAIAWQERGDEVLVTTRSESRASGLAGQGFRSLVADITKPTTLNNLPDVDTVLFSVGFDRSSGLSIREVYVDGLNHTLKALMQVGRLIYISTTGVYGQANGESVDETSACEPTRPGGQACLSAEAILRDSHFWEQTVILRLAGIYGPERIPNLKGVESGTPIVAPEHSYLNLIHVDDAVTAVLAATDSAEPPKLYNVSDNQPVLRREYYREAARRIGVDPRSIEFVDNGAQHTAGSSGSKRKSGNKRVCSDAIMHDLQLEWRYKNYAEGLASILGASG